MPTCPTRRRVRHGRHRQKRKDGREVHDAFQSIAGDSDGRIWRNDVRVQLESAQAGIVHLSFNSGLERQVVLVTSGELKNVASGEMQRWNDDR
jgi:hypothetical protein